MRRLGAWYATAYGEIGESNHKIAYGEDGEFFTRPKLLKLPNFPTIPISDLGRAPQCRLSIKSNIADTLIVNCQLANGCCLSQLPQRKL